MIAFLILCHNDPNHIARLANKLVNNRNNDVYIHVDNKCNIKEFKEKIKSENVYFIDDRVDVYWGGYSSVEATMKLIECSFNKKSYDRYVLLQGLDYPLWSMERIEKFFDENKQVEFIRGCNVSRSKDKYFYEKVKCYWFYDRINIFKKVINKLNRIFSIKIRNGYIDLNNRRYDIYWGSAQWALTGNAIKYILDFYKSKHKFNNYFKHVFPADETYFNTIIFNSHFRTKTINKGEEREKRGLVNWRNLHYFEYGECIRVFNDNDLEEVLKLEEMFIRKVTSNESSILLDSIDKNQLSCYSSHTKY